MNYVIRRCPERDTGMLERCLPDAIVYNDTEHEGALISFHKALRMANDDAVYIQDDVVLCKDFKSRTMGYIKKYPKTVIVFSSYFESNEAVRNDFAILENVSLLCTYIPKHIADAYLHAVESGEWKLSKWDINGQFDDLNFSKFLLKYDIEVFVVYPHLAGHLPGESVIRKSRPKNRICHNFDYEDTAWNWREG